MPSFNLNYRLKGLSPCSVTLGVWASKCEWGATNIHPTTSDALPQASSARGSFLPGAPRGSWTWGGAGAGVVGWCLSPPAARKHARSLKSRAKAQVGRQQLGFLFQQRGSLEVPPASSTNFCSRSQNSGDPSLATVGGFVLLWKH